MISMHVEKQCSSPLTYNLCFGLSKVYTNIQQDQKAKLDYHMSMLFAYMAGGEGGGGLEVLKCFVRGGSEFFLLALCVCVCVLGGGGSGSVPLLP